MKKETYKQATERLMSALVIRGWKASSLALKRPWVMSPQSTIRVEFHRQATYVNGYSMFLDRRGVSLEDFFEAALRRWSRLGKGD